jgi:hypothetical protein
MNPIESIADETSVNQNLRICLISIQDFGSPVPYSSTPRFPLAAAMTVHKVISIRLPLDVAEWSGLHTSVDDLAQSLQTGNSRFAQLTFDIVRPDA